MEQGGSNLNETTMGKYPLSDREKQRIIDLLEDTEPSKREVFMQNAASFAKWLAGACYDIYITTVPLKWTNRSLN